MTPVILDTPADLAGVAIILGCAAATGYLAGRGRTIRRYERHADQTTIAALVDLARRHHAAIGRLTDDLDSMYGRRAATRPAPIHRGGPEAIEAAARTTEHRAIPTSRDPRPLRERIAAGDPALQWRPDQPIKVARRQRPALAPIPVRAGR